MVETKENNKWHSTEEPHAPKNQPYRLWWGAAPPIQYDTPCVCIYTSYNQNPYKVCIRIDKYTVTQSSLDENIGHQEETHHPTHRFRRLFLDLSLIGWSGCASAMGTIKLPPSCSIPKLIFVVCKNKLLKQRSMHWWFDRLWQLVTSP